jgi:hypothetical protein
MVFRGRKMLLLGFFAQNLTIFNGAVAWFLYLIRTFANYFLNIIL